jgi:hypothetical protein
MNEAASDFYSEPRQALTVRYEDLVADPVPQLTRICEFIGEPYDPAMLDGRATATGVAAEHEWWKGDATGPLDRSRSGRWADEMPADIQHYVRLNMGDLLEEHGYGQRAVPARKLAIVPCGDAISAKYDDVLLKLASGGVAVRRPVPRDIGTLHLQEPLIFFGIVGQLDPDRSRPALERVLDLARLGLLLVTRRAQGRPVIWVRRKSLIRRHRSDGGERFLARMLQFLTVPMEADELPGLVGIDD